MVPLHLTVVEVSGDFNPRDRLPHLQYISSRPGVNLNIKDKELLTPLHYAVVNHRVDAMKILLNRSDVNVNCQRKGGLTPLHDAIQRHVKAIK